MALAELEIAVDLGVAGRRHQALRRVSRLAASAGAARPSRVEDLRAQLEAELRQRRQAGQDAEAVDRFAVLARRSLGASSRAVVATAAGVRGRPSSSSGLPGTGPRQVALLHRRPPPRARVAAITPVQGE